MKKETSFAKGIKTLLNSEKPSHRRMAAKLIKESRDALKPLPIKFTPPQLRIMKSAAKLQGMSLSEYITHLRGHGGKREGAGRKQVGREAFTIRMKPGHFVKLQELAGEKTVGEFLEDRIDNDAFHEEAQFEGYES